MLYNNHNANNDTNMKIKIIPYCFDQGKSSLLLCKLRNTQCILRAVTTPWSLEAQNEMLVSIGSAHQKCDHVFEDGKGLVLFVLVTQNLPFWVPTAKTHKNI